MGTVPVMTSYIIALSLLFPLLSSLPQVCSVVAFSQTLRRYTSLNHLAQAARAVLQNPSQISQMLADLNRVDFANVQVTPACRLQFNLYMYVLYNECVW